MNKLTIFPVLLFVFLLACHSYAQETKMYASNLVKKEKKTEKKAVKREMRKMAAANVSDFSLKSFTTDFGDRSNVSWTKTDRFDVANFIQNDQQVKAYYDSEGQLIGTTTNKTFADLPLKGQNTLKKRYADYNIESVLYYDFNKVSDAQMILFNGQYVDSKNYFVLISNGNKRIVLQVDRAGSVHVYQYL